MKLGSLFDGSGGFPLAGSLMGIEPVWAAEVEPYPISVTKSRFPNMKHLGSVTDVHGDKIEPVDIITFGSPCQDLSVAGKRAGLKHETEGDDETTRSGLFVEAVRIIKEMRDATNGVYPRFAVWENVPGAFSSNRGEDFRIVLEKLIQVAEPTAVMPDVPKAGWAYADSYRGDGWSIAYRTFDAQYWGVPQRRRRIYLVADFRGECAGEVLFKSQGLRGYFEAGRAPWQGITQDAERCTIADDREIPYTLIVRSGVERDSKGKSAGKGALIQENKSATLSTVQDQYLFQPVLASGKDVTGCLMASGYDKLGAQEMFSGDYTVLQPITFEPGIAQREGGHIYEGVSGTLRANAGDNRMAVAHATPAFFEWHSQDMRAKEIKNDTAPTLSAGMGMGGANMTTPMLIAEVPKAYSVENHPADSRVNLDESGKVQTLTSRMGTGGGNVPMVMEAIGLDRASFNQGKNAQFDFSITEDGTEPTLTARGPGAVCYCLQDKSIGRKESNSCHGLGVSEETAYTLTGIDRHAVAYGFDPGASRDVGDLWLEEQSKTLTNGTCPGHHNGVAYCTDVGWLNSEEGTSPTLLARMHKDPHLVSYWDGGQTVGTLTANNAGGNQRMPDKENFNAVIESRPPRYIVRRLTPTECARLQGFPDKWGHPDHKDTFTKEEYEFWLDVRNTHAIINGKTTKNYTKDQMLSWYNKLHTDGAEYKMWGNGIALPNALYVMQGIAEVGNG